jgi:hypothetical protein
MMPITVHRAMHWSPCHEEVAREGDTSIANGWTQLKVNSLLDVITCCNVWSKGLKSRVRDRKVLRSARMCSMMV